MFASKTFLCKKEKIEKVGRILFAVNFMFKQFITSEIQRNKCAKFCLIEN